MDMDGDGLLNGPSDWDTDGDGMPDVFEFCYSDTPTQPTFSIHPPPQTATGLGRGRHEQPRGIPSGPIFGEGTTSPQLEDTDQDEMPDQWEASNGLHHGRS